MEIKRKPERNDYCPLETLLKGDVFRSSNNAGIFIKSTINTARDTKYWYNCVELGTGETALFCGDINVYKIKGYFQEV